MKFVRPEEECGIFGVYNHPEAANLTYLGLYALQHRGQESCGIVSSDGMKLHPHRSMGLVADVFGDEEIFNSLPGKCGNRTCSLLHYGFFGEKKRSTDLGGLFARFYCCCPQWQHCECPNDKG